MLSEILIFRNYLRSSTFVLEELSLKQPQLEVMFVTKVERTLFLVCTTVSMCQVNTELCRSLDDMVFINWTELFSGDTT